MYKIILFLALYIPFQLALNPSEGVDLASVRVLILALFLIWLARGLARKNLWVPHNAQTMWLVSFLFLCAFSAVSSENKEWFGRKILFLFSIVPLYFVVAGVITGRREAIKVIKVLLAGGTVAAFIGIIQFFLQFWLGLDKTYALWAGIIKPFLGVSFVQAVMKNPSWLVNIGGNTYLRSTSFFPDPHMFSFYLGMLIPLAGGLYFLDKKEERKKKNTTIDKSVLWGISFFVLLAADILTFSRGGYLGLAGGVIMALFMARDQIKKAYFGLTAAAIGLLAVLLLFPSPVSERFHSIFDWREGSNQGRIETWNKAFQVWRENPILGVGLGNYPLAVKATASYREPIYAHNTYLDVAIEMGIFSLVSWAAFLFSVFISFYRQSKQNSLWATGAISIIIFSVHSLVETGIYSPSVLGALMILSGISCIKSKDNL